jgi:hypothetical protein
MAAHIRSPDNWLACFTKRAKLSFVDLVVTVDVGVTHFFLQECSGQGSTNFFLEYVPLNGVLAQ